MAELGEFPFFRNGMSESVLAAQPGERAAESNNFQPDRDVQDVSLHLDRFTACRGKSGRAKRSPSSHVFPGAETRLSKVRRRPSIVQ